MTPIKLTLILIFSFIFTNHPILPPAQTISAQVEQIVSGNTLVVRLPSQIPEKVRLIGISAPDLQQNPWGTNAKNTLSQWLPPQTPIRLETDLQTHDPYKRRLAYVWKNEILINEQLVQQGYVLADPHAPNLKYSDRLNHAQAYARTLYKGIWNPQNPMRLTPEEFRAQNSRSDF